MLYPATFTDAKEEGGFVVTFRDLPEAITQGDTFDEALEMAEDALLSVKEMYEEDGRTMPAPSPLQSGDVMVGLPEE